MPRHVADPDGTHDSRYYREAEVDALVAAGGGGTPSLLDGGTPDSTYGGIVAVDGGTP